jgi:hypothetical protein
MGARERQTMQTIDENTERALCEQRRGAGWRIYDEPCNLPGCSCLTDPRVERRNTPANRDRRLVEIHGRMVELYMSAPGGGIEARWMVELTNGEIADASELREIADLLDARNAELAAADR